MPDQNRPEAETEHVHEWEDACTAACPANPFVMAVEDDPYYLDGAAREDRIQPSESPTPPDPVCVCGENLSGHTSEHNFVDAEHYYARPSDNDTSPGKSDR